jgi:hypothetical protein
MRMSMRRFTRLTNAFSKKVENLRAAVSLHFAHYNFVRVHRTLRVTTSYGSSGERSAMVARRVGRAHVGIGDEKWIGQSSFIAMTAGT